MQKNASRGKLAIMMITLVAAAGAALVPRAYTPLPVGSVTPRGWLLTQLKLQADGLSGHLAQFWNDVMNSVWIGGSGDGGLHEFTPYWLNGVVPLAYLLSNAGIEELPPVLGIYKAPWGRNAWTGPACEAGTDMRGKDLVSGGYNTSSAEQCRDDCAAHKSKDGISDCYAFVVDNCSQPVACWLKGGQGLTQTPASCRCYGKNFPTPTPVNIKAQARAYIDYILLHQHADGWLGPNGNATAGGGFDGGDYWGPSNVLQALWQWAEAVQVGGNATGFDRASQAVLLHLLEQHRRMKTYPLESWASARWVDMAHSAEWVLDKVSIREEQKAALLDLIGMLHRQGVDWEARFESIATPGGKWKPTHNVNLGQGLKSAAVLARYNATARYHGHTMAELSRRRMDKLDAAYGQPTGMYLGDEITPEPPTRDPSRGIELCGVVETMFSYETMFSIHGDVAFADRAERVAYNALPATWASPTGGDMWAHQYLQAVNQINAIHADPHVWQHDNDFSETYGLEPNYGCCTANFHQGWPKFANSLFYTTPDGGVAVAMYAPASAKLGGGVTIDIDTAYPFGDTAAVTVTTPKALSVHLRIPSWAAHATLNGRPLGDVNGTMHQAAAAAGTTRFFLDFKPTVRLEHWDRGAVSVHRGALLYSLPIGAEYTVYAHHFGTDTMSNDYYLNPTTPWRFALDVDPAAIGNDLAFTSRDLVPGAAPFNHSNWPTSVLAPLRPLPSWGIWRNSARETPQSPACTASTPCGDLTKRMLVPHGGTELRIGELPVAYHGSDL